MACDVGCRSTNLSTPRGDLYVPSTALSLQRANFPAGYPAVDRKVWHTENCVAVKEPKLCYYNPETIVFTVYPGNGKF